jgi:hypothetical protein
MCMCVCTFVFYFIPLMPFSSCASLSRSFSLSFTYTVCVYVYRRMCRTMQRGCRCVTPTPRWLTSRRHFTSTSIRLTRPRSVLSSRPTHIHSYIYTLAFLQTHTFAHTHLHAHTCMHTHPTVQGGSALSPPPHSFLVSPPTVRTDALAHLCLLWSVCAVAGRAGLGRMRG